MNRGRAARGIPWILLAAGLAASLVGVLRTIPLDADTATPAVVAGEVARHGLDALRVWHYTQDNWLLSVILPDLALIAVLGAAPWLALAQGWLLLLACCGLTALLARRSMPTPLAFCLGALLLFAHPDSLGRYGFLANPVSHGVTMAWGLLGLLLAARWVERRGIGCLAGTAFCLVVAATSDPWAKPALLLPLLLSCAACAVWHPALRPRLLALGSLALLCLLGGTRWFGLLGFLPATRYQTTAHPQLAARAGAAIGVLGDEFSLLPWHGGAAASLTLPLLAALLLAAWRSRGRRGLALVPMFCVLSCAGTALAFVLSDLEVGLRLGRMMLNSYYLLPLLLAPPLHRAARHWRVLGLIAASLFAATGLVETRRLPPAADPGPPGDLYGFLQRHGLSHGYGPYWPTQANAGAWITRGRVVIRPLQAVGALPLQARGPQTYPWWYEPDDAAAPDGRVFFVAAPDRETCPSVAACLRAAGRSFGAPDRRLDWRGVPILVWNRPILDHLPDAATRAAAPLLGEGASIPVTAPLLWTGWSMPGGNGAWSSGERSMVILREASPPLGAQLLCATLRATGKPGRASQPVRVLLDGAEVGSWQVAPGVARRYCVRIAPRAASAILTLQRPRGPGWSYRRDVPGIALQALALDGHAA